jgi:hypothetical protein
MTRALVAVILIGLLSGCSAVGAIAYKIHGPEAIAAKYVPDRQPMLILVENFRRPSAAFTDAEILTRYLADELSNHDVAPLVDQSKVQELRADKPEEFGKMSIAAIGRTAGAKQVLYVQIVESDVQRLAGADTLQGRAAVRVRIVDAATGESRWPADLAEGYPLSYGTQLGGGDVSNVMKVRQQIYQVLAGSIAKLFYKWKPEDEEPQGFTQ